MTNNHSLFGTFVRLPFKGKAKMIGLLVLAFAVMTLQAYVQASHFGKMKARIEQLEKEKSNDQR